MKLGVSRHFTCLCVGGSCIRLGGHVDEVIVLALVPRICIYVDMFCGQ